MSGDPQPTRFCGACGHPSVSAHGGGWKCRDCGAELPHYVVFGGKRVSEQSKRRAPGRA